VLTVVAVVDPVVMSTAFTVGAGVDAATTVVVGAKGDGDSVSTRSELSAP
jgi:hypothetical protein